MLLVIAKGTVPAAMCPRENIKRQHRHFAATYEPKQNECDANFEPKAYCMAPLSGNFIALFSPSQI